MNLSGATDFRSNLNKHGSVGSNVSQEFAGMVKDIYRYIDVYTKSSNLNVYDNLYVYRYCLFLLLLKYCNITFIVFISLQLFSKICLLKTLVCLKSSIVAIFLSQFLGASSEKIEFWKNIF